MSGIFAGSYAVTVQSGILHFLQNLQESIVFIGSGSGFSLGADFK